MLLHSNKTNLFIVIPTSINKPSDYTSMLQNKLMRHMRYKKHTSKLLQKFFGRLDPIQLFEHRVLWQLTTQCIKQTRSVWYYSLSSNTADTLAFTHPCLLLNLYHHLQHRCSTIVKFPNFKLSPSDSGVCQNPLSRNLKSGFTKSFWAGTVQNQSNVCPIGCTRQWYKNLRHSNYR